MGKFAKLIGIDVALAVAAVALFSPGLLALSPLDPNPAIAAASVAAGVALVGAAGVANVKLLSGPSYRRLEIGDGTSSSPTASFDEVYETLLDHRDDRYVGEAAETAMRQMESAARKQSRLHVAIEDKFAPGSLSWQRFVSVVDSAVGAVTRNAALVANRIQSFDADGYEEASYVMRNGDYHYDSIPDDIQEERYALYQRALASIQDVLAGNERLLLEMERFSDELARLDAASVEGGNDEMLDEIRRLVDQTRLYADPNPAQVSSWWDS